ncbi:MAG TPA: M4 family metallopeptidase [Actinophytocola sp.]|uniref:M4 family metallopeptidase n=1 Tax=Actinophytocola sp. TaxID=1872138 RepID=UPI002DF7EEC3|nr:M4 family metallopeptidase [Actinophytocola sp.]
MTRRRVVVLAAAGALIAATVAATTAQAQPQGGASIDAATLAADAASSLVANHSAELHASTDDSFTQHRVISSHGLQYVSYDRSYKGLPVVGGDFVVVTNAAGQVLSTSVAQDQTINLASTTPSVSKDKAESVARGQLSTVDRVESTRLAVFALGSPKLAWETTVAGSNAEGPSRLTVAVDAATGAVLHTQEHVMHGTGTSGYNGPNPITVSTTQSGSTFLLRDPAHPTVQAQNATGNATFSGADDVWGNGNTTDRETEGLDALFAAETEEQMLSQWLGRNSFDGNGSGWPIRIGLNDLNAFYDGTQVQIGHNQQNQRISSIDVVAHELGHGIDDHTPGGISGGGTQEFVADVFGATTEGFANEPSPFDVPDFLVGEEINLVGQGPIRNMFNPAALGDPNCWSTAIPSTEVHAAAGPGNHWYYLLVNGSNPTNGQPASTTCNGSTITGIGLQTAMTIFYNAMLMKTTGSSYLRYRTWTLQAAKNLTPGNCANFNVVKAAWDAVSVPAQTADPTCTVGGAPVVTNPGNRTSTVGVATSLQMTASGGTGALTWSATGLPTGLAISAGTGLISGTPSTAGTFTVTVTATDSASPPQSGSTTFTWTIVPPGSCSSPGQKIGNPGFEVGSAPWTATANVIGAFAGQVPHSGTRFAWMDGYGTTHTDTLSQSVTLPAGCTNYTLTFWLHIDSSETTTTTQFDRLTVRMGSTTIATFSNLNKAAGYQLRTFNVAAFAGQTVTLGFTGTEDISLQTSFVVDDFALNVS